ncbi:hypothetical protein KAFR_0I01990 [Kazachstania africana CBS 2517]|uniref:t-SNARE coiled-coil homology domain-containing protein n=1 Tax=Kazachstania africana (strain ATCC 22294 / BCRC 22015 / CBS 2517 / CECT 1963 / NBRC 1671 / NRRL Y-8276) TaxID=1071382 RepID=H2B029_KAZAF|nr:hypothetical protein KAFR_0I01990 [Kazachstania africana CBS 2517]CCF59979.1 hypothetical protein KAFR_0I01990 [Kazachstania africana CBS 2517]
MFRDRTNLFLSYRRTFSHFADSLGTKNNNINDEFVGDGNDIELESYPMITHNQENNTLPPLFVDIARDIDEYLDQTNRRMEQLMKLYRKNSLPGFEDNTKDEKMIEELSIKILELFQRCYNVIKKLKTIFQEQFLQGKQLNKSELIILDNLTKQYADKIQWESNKFRILQNNYLKYLNKDDLKPILPKNNKESSQLLLLEEENVGGKERLDRDIESYSRHTLQTQMNKRSNERYLQERDEEITKLATSVFEVSTIFKEMQHLIIDQGTIVDRIDYNLENTVIELKSANRELDKATHYQKRTQKCKIILFLSLCVLVLFFLVMLKPHNKTVYKTVPPPKPVEEISIEEPANLDKVMA